MKPYAEIPSHRVTQIAGDLAVALAVYACVRLGHAVYDLVARLAEPGRSLQQAGTAIADAVASGGGGLADLPLIGGALAGLLETLVGGGRELAAAGAAQQAAVLDIASALGVLVAVVPSALLLVGWGRRRLLDARESAAAARLRDEGADVALFALRALTSRPLRELRSVSRDPAGAYAAGDVEGLAALELAALGLRPRRRSA